MTKLLSSIANHCNILKLSRKIMIFEVLYTAMESQSTQPTLSATSKMTTGLLKKTGYSIITIT